MIIPRYEVHAIFFRIVALKQTVSKQFKSFIRIKNVQSTIQILIVYCLVTYPSPYLNKWNCRQLHTWRHPQINFWIKSLSLNALEKFVIVDLMIQILSLKLNWQNMKRQWNGPSRMIQVIISIFIYKDNGSN